MDNIEFSTLIDQVNQYESGRTLFTTNLGKENGVKTRSYFHCFDRIWAWWNGVNFEKDAVAARIYEIICNTDVKKLSISSHDRVKLNLFKRNIHKIAYKLGPNAAKTLEMCVKRVHKIAVNRVPSPSLVRDSNGSLTKTGRKTDLYKLPGSELSESDRSTVACASKSESGAPIVSKQATQALMQLPRGLVNVSSVSKKGGNNCCFNSVLQLLYHSGAFHELSRNSGEDDNLSPLLKEMALFYEKYQKGQSVDADAFRAKLGFSAAAQEDAQEVLSHFLESFPQQNKMEMTTVKEWTEIFDLEEISPFYEKQSTDTTQIPLLPMYLDSKSSHMTPLRKLMPSIFLKRSEAQRAPGSQVLIDESQSFKATPPFLFLHICRFFSEKTEQGVVLRKNTKELELDQKYTIQETDYNLVGGVIHLGNSANNGHYITVLKQGDNWILFNDTSVRILDETTALTFLKDSYIVLLNKR